MIFSTRPSPFSALPLIPAYLLFPVISAVLLVSRTGMAPSELADAARYFWLSLAGLALFATIIHAHRHPVSLPRKVRLFTATLLGLGIAVLYIYITPVIRGLGPEHLAMLHELAPVAYVCFALAWAASCGPPQRTAFVVLGSLLGCASAICGLAALVFAPNAPLFQSISFTDLLGGSEYVATLLLVSLCASLRPGTEREPVGGMLAQWAIIAGLAATLSRSGLFTAFWVMLCFGPRPFRRRLLHCLALLGALAGTLLHPMPAALELEQLTVFWMWFSGIQAFQIVPDAILSGFGPATMLPIDVPPQILATIAPGEGGISAHLFTPFWLRTAVGFGILVPLGAICAFMVLLVRRPTRFGSGLVAALLAQGMTFPLLHDPLAAVPLGLAMAAAFIQPTDFPRKSATASRA